MIVAIDGSAGTGKSTVAKKAAKTLGFIYFDSGATYRAVAWFLLERGIDDPEDERIAKALETFKLRIEGGKFYVGETDVTQVIRTPKITKYSSIFAKLRVVREHLRAIQRDYAKAHDAVFEGRDMGSVVFPDADVKIFLTASLAVRAQRRLDEWKVKFPEEAKKRSLKEMESEILERDKRDMERSLAPLKKADDAIEIDTSNLTIDQVLGHVIALVKEKQ